jgi:hypothetical protein
MGRAAHGSRKMASHNKKTRTKRRDTRLRGQVDGPRVVQRRVSWLKKWPAKPPQLRSVLKICLFLLREALVPWWTHRRKCDLELLGLVSACPMVMACPSLESSNTLPSNGESESLALPSALSLAWIRWLGMGLPKVVVHGGWCLGFGQGLAV